MGRALVVADVDVDQAAPAASQAWAVSTSSSSVTGRAGTSALLVSAPVGATVIRVWAGWGVNAGCAMRAILPRRAVGGDVAG